MCDWIKFRAGHRRPSTAVVAAIVVVRARKQETGSKSNDVKKWSWLTKCFQWLRRVNCLIPISEESFPTPLFVMSNTFFYADGADIALDLVDLTKDEIIAAGWPIKFGRQATKTRKGLYEGISKLHIEDQDRIRAVAFHRRGVGCSDENGPFSKKQKVVCEMGESDETPELFKTQSQDVVQSCIARFIDRTGNVALSTVVCIVCAREVALAQAKQTATNSIPNRQLLTPHEHHAAHVLTDGLLLHVHALRVDASGIYGSVCDECRRSLERNKLPRLALANGMWIGDVPFELSVLTLPEKILIARYFPAAYIVKLFPKGKRSNSVNSGLRGNVSTYRLNTSDIADMITDNIFPRPAKLLAAVIGVTIVGPNNVPEKTLPDFLHARRHRMRTALIWLKNHNPVYSNIVISEDRLAQFAEYGIPEELLGGVRYSDEVDLLERERAGYVPEEDDVTITGNVMNAGGASIDAINESILQFGA